MCQLSLDSIHYKIIYRIIKIKIISRSLRSLHLYQLINNLNIGRIGSKNRSDLDLHIGQLATEHASKSISTIKGAFKVSIILEFLHA